MKATAGETGSGSQGECKRKRRPFTSSQVIRKVAFGLHFESLDNNSRVE